MSRKKHKSAGKPPDCVSQATRSAKELAAANISAAAQAFDSGYTSEARSIVESILSRAPDDARAHKLMALICRREGRLEEAIVSAGRAVGLVPADADFQFTFAWTLHEAGRYEESIPHYRQASLLRPSDPRVWYNLGNALRSLGRTGEAVDAYKRSVEIRPDHFWANFSLGSVLNVLGKSQEAVPYFRKATAINPADPWAHYGLGTALKELGNPVDAVRCFQRAFSLDTNQATVLAELLSQSMRLCLWKGFDRLSGQLIRMVADSTQPVSPTAFLAVSDSPAEQLSCAKAFARDAAGQVSGYGISFSHSRQKKPRIVVGYLSADFREHVVSSLSVELFERHDRNRFQVLGYSYGRDDGSPMRLRLSQAFDRFVDIRDSSTLETAKQIYRDNVDILVDLTGYTRDTRPQILALRPASIQVSYLGFSGTMGADFVDYMIADRFLIPPEQERFYSEKLVIMPFCHQVNPSSRAVASGRPTRLEQRLPEEGLVFCCFNNAHKLTPRVFDLWMRLLKAVPGSVLWLKAAIPPTVQNLRTEAGARGVDPTRLVFASNLPHPEYLANYTLADLFLDTFPYTAGSTASDALLAGCPLLTCVGESYVSRMAGSVVQALGLPELVVSSLDEYESRALHFASNPGELFGIREKLRGNRMNSPLFDSARFTRNLEAAFETMVDIYLKGEAPRSFDVADVGSGNSGSIQASSARD